MAQNITVNFAANREGIIERKLNLVCENSNLQYILRGEGIKVDIAIKMLDGLSMEGVAPQDEDAHNEQQQQLNELEFKHGDSNVSRSNNNIIIDAPGDEQQDMYKDNESDKSNLITEDKGETLSITQTKFAVFHIQQINIGTRQRLRRRQQMQTFDSGGQNIICNICSSHNNTVNTLTM